MSTLSDRLVLIFGLLFGLSSWCAAAGANVIVNGSFELGVLVDHGAPKGWKTNPNNHCILGSESMASEEAAEGKVFVGMKLVHRNSTVPLLFQNFFFPAAVEKFVVSGKVRLFLGGAFGLLRIRTVASFDGDPLYYNGSEWIPLKNAPAAGAPRSKDLTEFERYHCGDTSKLSEFQSATFPYEADGWKSFQMEIPGYPSTKDYMIELGVGGAASGEGNLPSVGWDEIAIHGL